MLSDREYKNATGSQSGKTEISLILELKNLRKKVSFLYDHKNDSPKKVAEELTKELGIDPSLKAQIAQKIHSKTKNRVLDEYPKSL